MEAKRLASWKKSFHCKAERLMLIRLVFGNIPNYYFSLYCALVSVCKSIEKITRDFL